MPVASNMPVATKTRYRLYNMQEYQLLKRIELGRREERGSVTAEETRAGEEGV